MVKHTHCLSIFEHFVKLVLKGLVKHKLRYTIALKISNIAINPLWVLEQNNEAVNLHCVISVKEKK